MSADPDVVRQAEAWRNLVIKAIEVEAPDHCLTRVPFGVLIPAISDLLAGLLALQDVQLEQAASRQNLRVLAKRVAMYRREIRRAPV